MAKTKEERAYEHYPIDLQKSNDMETSLKNDAGWDGYVLGATEQQKIDIEKACEALYVLQDELNADLMNIEQAKEIMRKAMEE